MGVRIKIQKRLIHETDWDCLVILDACRYDYLKKTYEDYNLRGNLKKAFSPASSTGPWLRNIFNTNDFKDVIYVSGQPRVNSIGENVTDFSGRDCFRRVIDVWNAHWNDELNTIEPKFVSKATRIARAKYPNSRIISHFMQPHSPYLSLGGILKENRFNPAKSAREETQDKGIGKKFRNVLWDIVRKTLSRELFGRLRTFPGIRDFLKIRDQVEIVAKKYGDDGLRKIYEENLRLALEEVSKLKERLPGTMVVTSDHGDLLGENRLYGHPTWSNHPILREVPWLTLVRNSNKS